MASTDLKVIIAGCGIGGLSAAIALELAGIDYTILEESPALDSDLKSGDSATNVLTKTTHIGGAVQVAPTAIHFLSQLGIYDEMKEISKPVSGLSMNDRNLNYIGRIDLSTHRERQVHFLFICLIACTCIPIGLLVPLL
jgi:2-polyprenyl-6-methoxyphenol hydroxylase-like FAD-dependent oxidoreductase